ncbi:2Fe-2S iron-sulfur cluster-binding protein [Clostridium estertheticum]|uniref:[Fe-Fe] hydrogenase large subunit C-terminal domain-containing protein n=1 Tax=Clostridium estertheticum TaxID=238834 RepID=UPI001C0C4398|nr:[Fe-Fe] hydrogenase large subunit C-terminal domain-containing protein [Clostridium estertheticum]MBU3214674.1 (2Fe-2S)-binding protein [Clostridium estertheticum]WAG57087.1 2Fe-2S iron-sulfur cluster-binding protein [Clostridium estertheticum]
MEFVNVTINDKLLSVPKGITILAAAVSGGIRIPTLCTIKMLNPRANCGICVVEVEGGRTYKPACVTRVSEGMVVRTDTPALRKSRKTTLELLLSRHAVDCHHCLRIGSSKCEDLDPKFCEMCFFCDCVRDGFCELQTLAREYKVDALPYEMEPYKYEIDSSTGSIVRNPNKCIKCRRCSDICNSVQTVHALNVINRGSEIMVTTEGQKRHADSSCVQCGRCVQSCPTGALFFKEHIDALLYNTHNYDITTIAQISSDVLEELSTLFKFGSSELDIRIVAAGLRKIGVDYVVTDDFASAKAINAAASALADKIKRDKKSPIIITDSYAAAKFMKHNFADFSELLLNYASPQQEFGKYAKTVFAAEKQLGTKNIRTISIVSDNENAAEAVENGSVDFVVNARELYRIFLRTGVNPKRIHPSELDSFGSIENSYVQFGKLFAPVTWEVGNNTEKLDLYIGNTNVKAAVAKNLGQVRELLTEVKNGISPYNVVRINA